MHNGNYWTQVAEIWHASMLEGVGEHYGKGENQDITRTKSRVTASFL